MEKLLGNLFSIKDRLLGKERKSPPNVVLNKDSKAVLRQITLDPPQNLEEVPFLGAGEGSSIISKVYLERSYPGREGLKRVSDESFKTGTSSAELQYLLSCAQKEKRFPQIRMLGHLHPTGKGVLSGKKFVVEPMEALLDPSQEDLNFAKSFRERYPEVPASFFAIVANTPRGSCLKIWGIKDLESVKRLTDLDRIPSQTIELSSD